ncbi:DUF3794 domain-containing protein [Bacillus sp. V3B]|uniref:CsxC family protein n=1 Tax=Bacillus sp. V3B TaxID=2804915 RepID=UPI00210C824A|nr:DUF3794 domain-containing protein [Bacillus sp. V3B]MCQ6276131.1 DUF3794 domain-containing protein [Bacillus sp. V3B]
MTKDHKKECLDVNVSATLPEVASEEVDTEDLSVTPGGDLPATTAGNVIMRVPITLAERTISTSLSANIHFDDPVLEIKDVKKRVKIIQCSLMLDPVTDPDDVFSDTPGRLFIRGFVRKNFQYASPTHDSSDSCVTSVMKSHTVDIPFEFVTIIPADDFISPPERPLLNTRAEFDFFTSQPLGKGFPEKDHLLSSDLSQFHQTSTQFYNQFPFCEIISSNITEWDEAIDRRPLHGDAPFEEGFFHNMVEKIFLTLTIKVLQNQQAIVNVMTPNGD